MNNKLKIIYISENQLLEILKSKFTIKPKFEGLPDDAEVERVFHRPDLRAFGFLVSHPSFEEVKPGNIAPEIVGQFVITD